QRTSTCGDGADKTFAKAQLSLVDRGRVQALGRVELQHGVGAQHIKRADLRNDVLGDLANDAVQPLLRFGRFGHQLAKTLQKNTGAATSRISHGYAPKLRRAPPNQAARKAL